MCNHCKSNRYHSYKKVEGCSSKAIKQCNFDKNGGVYEIQKSGNYHLSKDVKGTISIQVDNVCLDLCCHTINASGAPNAIVIEPVKNVSISNGNVIFLFLRKNQKN